VTAGQSNGGRDGPWSRAPPSRGRENAEKRGLSGRVSFIEGPATDHASPADVVISCGAYQAFGTVFEALRVLRGLVKPAGLLLFGAEIWDLWIGVSRDLLITTL
jgi:hypothetical protein